MKRNSKDSDDDMDNVLRVAAAQRIEAAAKAMKQADLAWDATTDDWNWRDNESQHFMIMAGLHLLMVIAVCAVKIAGDGVFRVEDGKVNGKDGE